MERHLLQGSEHRATRRAEPLRSPRPFLPPLFFLQCDSPDSLSAALKSFGIRPEFVGLAPCGGSDCYVIGDPSRVPPARQPQTRAGEEGAAPRNAAVAAPPPVSRLGRGPFPTVWVDMTSFQVKKIELPEVQVWLGPLVVFERVQVPSWILIQEPDQAPVRFDVQNATPVNAPASAFSTEWLLSPLPIPAEAVPR